MTHPASGTELGPTRPGGGLTVPRWMVATGHLAILNLCWLLASLPLVTALPAAIAMQTALHGCLDGDETRPAAAFVRELRRLLPRWLPHGTGCAVAACAGWLALSFWTAVPRALIAVPMTAVLVALMVTGGAFLAVLVEVAAARPGADPHVLAVEAGRLLVGVPALLVWIPVLGATWVALLLTVPSLGIGFGAALPGHLLHRRLRGVPRRATSTP